jgi:uncharacterized repeat protein (TIGR03806 family)
VKRLPGVLLALLSGCGTGAPSVQLHDANAYPAELSHWGLVIARGTRLQLGQGVLPYDLNTPLFTDYAHKLRTVWLPAGTQAAYSAEETFDFPVGTLLSKTFYYPTDNSGRPMLNDDDSSDFAADGLNLDAVRLIETRLLVRQPDGWDALAYVWDDAQQEATLEIAGEILRFEAHDGATVRNLTYIVPTRDECGSCHITDHASGEFEPIGPKARHLDKDYRHYADGSAPQLARWTSAGYLAGRSIPGTSANALWEPYARDALAHRARSYLDVNCGHCHNPRGTADTSGLFLDMRETDPRRLGLCKPPVAAGRGSGGLAYSLLPGQPDASILSYRMRSTELDVMMPELGRTTVHLEGVALIDDWIHDLPGACLSQPGS